jgi:UDP-GlcNAc:undecaprenyl-phosphate GlcNAc-1-phosphate transferase
LKKDDIKLALMSFIAFLTYGIAGVSTILLMKLLSYFSLGRDLASSHGISLSDSSRLGGLAITIVVGCYLVGMLLLTPYVPGALRSDQNFYLWLAVAVCAALGLAEDIKADFLTPALRLACKFLVFGVLLFFWPNFVPTEIGIPGIDTLLSIPLIAWVLVTIFCVGFINAFNMADGANGLVPGICVAAFTIFFLEYGRPTEGLFLFACTMFLIFNLISGWFFLGDMGSYGIGAIILCYGLNGVAVGDFSAAFMATLLAYPCLDFVVSIVRRLRVGRSPFSADNDHLHNRLHWQIKQLVKSKVLANSLTGLTISGCTAGLTLYAYSLNWLPITSNQWIFLFIIEVFLYGVGFKLTQQDRGTTQYSEPV